MFKSSSTSGLGLGTKLGAAANKSDLNVSHRHQIFRAFRNMSVFDWMLLPSLSGTCIKIKQTHMCDKMNAFVTDLPEKLEKEAKGAFKKASKR